MKRLILFAAGMYFGAGLFSALLMKQAIPALNPLGISYIGATWPAQIYCARTSRGCNAMPPEWLRPYFFTFRGDNR